MKLLAIDSRVSVLLLSGNPLVEAAIASNNLALPEPVISTLLRVTTPTDYEAVLGFINSVSHLRVTDRVLDLIEDITNAARPHSRPVEERIVAAICVQYKVPLLTTNVHFKLYELMGLQVRIFPG